MKPRQFPYKNRQRDLFRPELVNIVDPGHGLVKLAKTVNWNRLDEMFGKDYCPDNGRPAISTRLMVSLQYLKYTFNLSDDDVVAGWVENPYWQYLSGMQFFEHAPAINPSSMTRWRQRIGESGAEELLKETIAAGLKLKVVKPHQLKRVNVDTTVQEKDIRFPTEIGRCGQAARSPASSELQPQCQATSSRYAHARQMKRARGCTRKLKTYLGRVIRDIGRKCPHPDEELQSLLGIATRIFHQQRKDKNKVYSVHEPAVECISKGKAHKRYEFGCKVSVAATSRGGWFVGAQAMHGNPYDGHTLKDTLEQIDRIARSPEHVFVDMVTDTPAM